MKERDYVDIDLRLERQGDSLTARVVDSPVGREEPVAFVPPPESLVGDLVQGMRAVSLEVDVRAHRRLAPADASPAATPAATPAPRPAAPVSLKAVGKSLFTALFTGPNLEVLRHSLHVVGTEKRLRLRLGLEAAPELASLPWELMYDPERHRFLCQFQDFSMVRVIDSATPETPLEVDGPVRMLVAISSPSDLPALDVEHERRRLAEAVAPLEAEGRLDVEWLVGATLDAVHDAVQRDEFHVFHFIGHGGTDESGEGVLAFTAEDGRARLVPADVLRVVLSGSPFRLTVLNACEGGRTSATDPYASTAISLVEQGVPAVVAMQFEISDVAAIEFSRALYTHVTAGRAIDFAVTMARQKVLIRSRDEWATPVLYLRARTSRLFVLPEALVATWKDEPLEPAEPPGPLGPLGLAFAAGEAGRPEKSTEPGQPPEPLEPTEPPEPAEPPARPRRPTDVEARPRGSTVELVWSQPEDPRVRVEAWEVVRDRVALPVTAAPRAVDEKVPKGAHRYTVSAVSADGERSVPSEPITVTVRRRLPLLVGLAVLLAAGLGLVLVLVRPSGALAAPTNVHLTSSGLPVRLAWDAPSADAPVDHWEVIRDGTPIGTTKTPVFTDLLATAAGHRYEVRAVGTGGEQSPLSAPVVATFSTTTSSTSSTEPTTSTKSTKSTTSTTSTTTEKPVTAADLAVTFDGESPGAGSGETDLRFGVADGGPATATDVRLDIALSGDGKIYDVQYTLAGDSSTVFCKRTTSAPFTATCDVGKLPTKQPLSLVVTVAGDAFSVKVTASSADDPESGNDVLTHTHPHPTIVVSSLTATIQTQLIAP